MVENGQTSNQQEEANSTLEQVRPDVRSGQLIATIGNGSREISPSVLSELMGADGAAVMRLARLAYQDPELVLGGKTVTAESLRLESIREAFPDVIKHFTDERIAEIVAAYKDLPEEYMLQKVMFEANAQKELLQATTDTEDIATIEIIMRRLISDGSKQQMGSREYVDVLASHKFYTALATEALEKGQVHMESKELEKLYQTGQNLLLNTRAYLVNVNQVDIENTPRHEDPQLHYRGKVAELRTLQAVGRTMQSIPEYKSRGEQISRTITPSAVRLQMMFPEHADEISDMFLGDEPYKAKISAWTDAVGQAYEPTGAELHHKDNY